MNRAQTGIKKYIAGILVLISVAALFGCSTGAQTESASASQSKGVQAWAAISPAASPTPSSGSLNASASPSVKPTPSVLPSASATPALAPVEKPPLKGVVIGIDPGHQLHQNSDMEPVAPGSSEMKMKVTSGTQGVKSKVEEHVVNLNVALKLRDMLEDAGATVVMTRTAADVDISNKERAQIFNDKKVDLGIRIHANGIDDPSVQGAFMLIPKNNPFEAESKLAAKLIIDSYTQLTGIKKLETQVRSDQTGFNWSERPIVNIEMGHMSNPDEDMKITDKDFQTTMAKGIYNGIVKYFKEKQAENN